MRKFQFKLQSLLKYKRHLEQVAKQEMAQAVADVLACEQRIIELKKDRISAMDLLDSLVEKGMGAGQFNRYRQFITTTDQMIHLERNRQTELEKILDEKRETLKQKTIDKKALERLREKKDREYTHEMIREEQKSLDEMTSLKTAREVNNERT
ncbi:flagellar export protein FliJ [Desulfobacter hydrogenophilus]|uniref:Flagellar FliJ protein n=1 Tax=Desulfobacter hydrogenophilus TaxID=2291 RepID=A0A328FHK3_9BACT|nr:flagellar export protein FliJ [Desulfobacter hydrogenophilus]NDY73399.1 flagellar export protein FliJ [Desulfobacter hydrogenophilus]QBH12946.1 flagellar export protein FliJ [Desulfobacter hydrogenophilus]RAM03929.1 flagellar export protein FliJ [Desulfobacter hydrogenophilus]